jgi:hypothetical protein
LIALYIPWLLANTFPSSFTAQLLEKDMISLFLHLPISLSVLLILLAPRVVLTKLIG